MTRVATAPTKTRCATATKASATCPICSALFCQKEHDETSYYQRVKPLSIKTSRYSLLPSPRGLGATVDLVERVVAADTEAASLLTETLRRPVGSNQHTVKGVDIINTHPGRPSGTSKSHALRKLRKDAPKNET